MSESNVPASMPVVVVSEANVKYLAEELRGKGYQPFFCDNSKRDCAKARRLMRRYNVEVNIVGALVSLRAQSLVDFADQLGIRTYRI